MTICWNRRPNRIGRKPKIINIAIVVLMNFFRLNPIKFMGQAENSKRLIYDRNSLLELEKELVETHLNPLVSHGRQPDRKPNRIQPGYDGVEIV